jgi:hypothetical protein
MEFNNYINPYFLHILDIMFADMIRAVNVKSCMKNSDRNYGFLGSGPEKMKNTDRHTYTHTHRHNHTWFPALNSSGLSQLVFIEEPHPNPPHSEPSAWDTCFMGLGNQ